MNALKFRGCVAAAAVLLSIGATTQAATLYVNCGGKSGLSSIGAALKALQNSESRAPATINIAGACRENVQIRDMDRVTLNAIGGASLTDASNGQIETMGIYRSNGIVVSGLTVIGGSDAISVGSGTVRLVGVTARDAVYSGVGVYAAGDVILSGGTLQGNGYAGLGVFGGDATAAGVTSQGNWDGIFVDRGRVQYRASDPFYDGGSVSAPAIITGNNDVGIRAEHNAAVVCSSCQITFNYAGGASLDLGASVSFRRTYLASGAAAASVAITDSTTGPGVTIGDLSIADFPYDPNTVIARNNAPYQVACNAATAVTRRAQQFAAGATNCTN